MTKRERKFTQKMKRQIRSLYLEKGQIGRLEFADREFDDPTSERGYRRSHDATEWEHGMDGSTFNGSTDIKYAVGRMTVYEGLRLEIWTYLPNYRGQESDSWDLEDQFVIEFNGTEWVLRPTKGDTV
jgi:hypothetical protein